MRVLVLGLDTATPAVSVALHDGERVIAAASALDARRHSELLMPMIAKILADDGASRDDLTAIAVGVDPGPTPGCGWAWSPRGCSGPCCVCRCPACAHWTSSRP